MRIAQVAPLHEAVPPRFYGGTASELAANRLAPRARVWAANKTNSSSFGGAVTLTEIGRVFRSEQVGEALKMLSRKSG